jgi:hypothetical protein
MFSFSHVRNATRLHDERLGALRHLSSSGQGLRATVDEQLDRWKAGDEAPPLVGRMGLGLPLSNVYSTYFGVLCILCAVRDLLRLSSGKVDRLILSAWTGGELMCISGSRVS